MLSFIKLILFVSLKLLYFSVNLIDFVVSHLCFRKKTFTLSYLVNTFIISLFRKKGTWQILFKIFGVITKLEKIINTLSYTPFISFKIKSIYFAFSLFEKHIITTLFSVNVQKNNIYLL